MIRYTIECLPEDCPIKGNAMASGDDAYDLATEEEILAQLDNGNPWAWCCVRVKAIAGDVFGEDYLGCCSYTSEEDFQRGGYFESMKEQARADLERKLESARLAMAEEVQP